VKLHALKGGLPGKVVPFYIVPLPACRQAGIPPSRAGFARHLPANAK